MKGITCGRLLEEWQQIVPQVTVPHISKVINPQQLLQSFPQALMSAEAWTFKLGGSLAC